MRFLLPIIFLIFFTSFIIAQDEKDFTYFEKLRFYPRLDNVILPKKTYSQDGLLLRNSIGIGMDFHDVKLEALLPLGLYDQGYHLARSAFDLRAGLNFVTTNRYFFSLMLGISKFKLHEADIYYLQGNPNVQVPIHYYSKKMSSMFNVSMRFSYFLKDNWLLSFDCGVVKNRYHSILSQELSDKFEILKKRDYIDAYAYTNVYLNLGIHYILFKK
jgi:hypothetical protein